jgi:Asp-tRNA(Asn)/Glu-tRNA(Gln) amidotransferase A subunit family amidase
MSEPQDTGVDRRAFLARMAWLSAAAPAGIALFPGEGSGMSAAEGPPGADSSGGTTAPAARGGVAPAAPPGEAEFAAARARGLRGWDLGGAVQEDPTELTVAAIVARIDRGELDPRALVEAYLSRIRSLDGVLRAWNTIRPDEALAEATRTAGWARGSGLLRGVPLAIKDNYYTADLPTTANSHIFRDFRPSWDATTVRRLRSAGGIVLGKTQMGPLATTRATTPEGVTTTRNAWAPGDPARNPGGSSTGSATAVAARMAASSIGTQTGGSITAPANAQGLTGLKPTMGRVSVRGIIPLSYTRDHPGPIARDALDAALLLQAMAGEDPLDPRTRGLPPVPDYLRAAEPFERRGRPALRWETRIGVLPGYLDATGEGEAVHEARARGEMLRTLESLGARLVEISLPEDWELLTGGALNNIRLPERSEPFLPWLRSDVRLFGTALSGWINGLLLSGDEYLLGQRAKERLLRRVLDQIFDQCDVVVQTAPVPFDIIGLPLIAFPIGFAGSAEALPLGAMLGGLPFGEERLLSLAAAYQSVTDWHRRRPADPSDADRRALPAGPIPWWTPVAEPRGAERLSMEAVIEWME